MVLDADGNISQSVTYIPYGEIFVEERNGTWNTPYLFNGKELDEETGLYYYGARYLNPTSGMWLSVDPLFEKYVGMSPYNYCAGNPVKLVDVDGREIKNGHENEFKTKKRWYDSAQRDFNKKYGNESKTRDNFSSRREYRRYRTDKRNVNRLKTSYERIERKYNQVNTYIGNYKKVDKEGFDKINGLKYKTGKNEYVSYDIEIFIDNNLTEWGGAKSSLRKNKDGVYSGGISIESGFSETDNHLAHEFGHQETYSSNPEYWMNNVRSDINCQDNPNHPQSINAINWQKKWDALIRK